VSELIDTTEMYLRTVFELVEEGVVPLRARIAERLHQSGPTVSQTVARMERDGLLSVEDDRHLHLSEVGRKLAVAVMRKHRLAELLLVQVIGLDWEDVHIEACRWEHVMSEAVERRLVALLDNPHYCPHGNPIPGLEDLGADPSDDAVPALLQLKVAAGGVERTVVVHRISEQLQSDAELLRQLKEAGVQPGRSLRATASNAGIRVDSGPTAGGEPVGMVLPAEVAEHIFVTAG